jgi:hypothetical protein
MDMNEKHLLKNTTWSFTHENFKIMKYELKQKNFKMNEVVSWLVFLVLGE